MSQILRQSTQVIVVIGPFVDVTDGFTPETGVTLSGADEAELLKGNSSSTTDISGATFAAITGCDGWYALTLTTSLTDTVGALTIMVNDDSVCLPVFARFQVIPAAAYDAMYATGANPALEPTLTLIRAQLPASLVGGRMDSHVGSIADGVISLTKFTQNYFDAVASYVWASSVGFFAGVSDSFGSAIADLWNRVDVNVSTRAAPGAAMDLIDNAVDAGALATDAVTEIQSGLATSAAVGLVQQGVNSILTRLPADLINGRIDAHIGSVADGVLSFGKFSQDYWDGVSAYVWTASVGQYGTVSDSFGESLNSIRNEMENVASEVWDVQLSAHLNSGSTGAALNAAGAAGDPWSTALPGAYGAGTAGFIVGTNLDATVSSRLASASYTAPDNASIAAIGVIVTSISTRLPASLVGGRIDAHVGSVADGVLTAPKFSQNYFDTVSSYVWTVSVGQYAGTSDSFAGAIAEIWNKAHHAGEVWDIVLSAHLTAGSTGFALNGAGSAGDPWNTALPGAYAAGTAGNIIGNRVDVAVSSRLAAASYTTPPTAVENADALLGRNIAGGSNGGRDVTSALRILRNRFLRGVSTLTVYQEDDATPAWTSSLTTDATAVPVVQSDPA